MRSIRSVLVALVAVVAMGVLGAASASAHEYFIEGKSMTALGLSEETVTSQIGEASLSMTSLGVNVVCVKNSGAGTIKQGGAGSTTFRLEGCTVAKPAHCRVKQPIVLSNTIGRLVETESKFADEFSPEKAGGYLFTMEFENSGGECSLANTEWPVEGQLTGLVGSEAESEAGVLSFTNKSGSDLVVSGGSMNATFKDTVKLSGVNKGKKWSAKK